MAIKTPHHLIKLITEWLQDTSRKLSRRHMGRLGAEWLSFDPNTQGWHPDYEYQFDDELKPKIVSSLKDEELKKFAQDRYWGTRERAIADAAAQRAIEDLKVPELEWTYPYFGREQECIAAILAIEAYLSDLRKGKL